MEQNKNSKHRCPDCNKLMIRHKHQKDFWWNCSGYPNCFITARDYKGKPEFLKKEQIAEVNFLGQLQYIKGKTKDLRTQILIRLIQKKGGLNELSKKHILMYYELVEPIRTTISFTNCCRCNYVLNAEDSLKHGENWYVCDCCWSH